MSTFGFEGPAQRETVAGGPLFGRGSSRSTLWAEMVPRSGTIPAQTPGWDACRPDAGTVATAHAHSMSQPGACSQTGRSVR